MLPGLSKHICISLIELSCVILGLGLVSLLA